MKYNIYNKKIEKEVELVKRQVKDLYGIIPSNNILLLLDQLYKLKDKEGVYLELGTFRGSTLLSCAEFTKAKNINTKLYGIDTFEGFPEQKQFHKYDLPNHYKLLLEKNLITEFHYDNAKKRTENFTNIEHLKPVYFQETNGMSKLQQCAFNRK